MAEARTCYDHLAGRRGVELRDRLLATSALRRTGDRDHALTAHGERLIAAIDIDLDQLRSSRRIFARSCLDWTQRRPHLAGALPAGDHQHVRRPRMARARPRSRPARPAPLRPTTRPMAHQRRLGSGLSLTPSSPFLRFRKRILGGSLQARVRAVRAPGVRSSSAAGWGPGRRSGPRASGMRSAPNGGCIGTGPDRVVGCRPWRLDVWARGR